MKIKLNKKVLLRERKRHTDRGVSSTTEVGYPTPLSGYPPPRQGTPVLAWGPLIRVPPQSWLGGVSRVPPIGVPPGQGTPLIRVPPSWLMGVPPIWGTPTPSGYPPVGVPPPSWLGGVPGNPPWVWTDITFPSYYVRGR